jgi:hypothetical protein
MSLPPTPTGYISWNEYITLNAPALAAEQGLTFMEAKCAIKLRDVAMPVRQAVDTPSYRIYNQFSTWDQRAVSPTQGRPWTEVTPIPESTGLVSEDEIPLFTENDSWLVTE